MTKSESMIKGVEAITLKEGYQYCGKRIYRGKTYYVFVDDDYLPHYYRPEQILYAGKLGE